MRLLATWLFAIAVFTGCGGGDDDRLPKEQYEREFQAIIEQVEEMPDPLAAVGEDPSPQEQAAAFEQALDRIQEVADQLDQLQPPEEIAPAHDDFIMALRSKAEADEPIVEALRRGDLQKARDLAADTSPEVAQQAAVAREEFEEAGYDVGLAPLP